jgi:hypothetical protein
MIRSALFFLLLLVLDLPAQSPTPSPTSSAPPSFYRTGSAGGFTMSSPKEYARMDSSGRIAVVDPDHVIIDSKWEPCIVREGDHYIVRFHRLH